MSGVYSVCDFDDYCYVPVGIDDDDCSRGVDHRCHRQPGMQFEDTRMTIQPPPPPQRQQPTKSMSSNAAEQNDPALWCWKMGRSDDGRSLGYNHYGATLTHEHEHNSGRNVSSSSRDYYYYGVCLFGGVLSSSIRWIQTPLDVVKCNMQVSPIKYSGGLVSGLRTLWTEEGITGWYKGLRPTMIAYSIQTGGKYFLYGITKDRLSSWVDCDSHTSNSYNQDNKGWMYVLSAAFAEGVADVFMCPWEMQKVRLQTSTVKSTINTMTNNAMVTSTTPQEMMHFLSPHPSNTIMVQQQQQRLLPWISSSLSSSSAGGGGSWGALYPLWARQVPSTIMNMYVFENTVNFIYRRVLGPGFGNSSNRKSIEFGSDKHNKINKGAYSVSTQLFVTFVAGYVAGCLSAVVSHPADSLVSLMTVRQRQQEQQLLQNRKPNNILHRTSSSSSTSSLTIASEIISEVGFIQLATKGLIPRILILGTTISIQWLIYDSFKTFMGLGTTGG